MAMSKAQKNSLQRNRVYLINNMMPNEELCSYLRAGDHMTESMEQEIMAQPSTSRKVGKLLDMMSRRSARAFDAFIEALVLTQQEHVAEVLDRNKTTDLVRKRDAERDPNMHTQASSSGLTNSSIVPSGSAGVSTSSSVTQPSSHSNAVLTSSGQVQCTPSATAGCSKSEPSASSLPCSAAAANEMHSSSVPGASAVPPSPPVQAMDTGGVTDVEAMNTEDVADVVDAVIDFGENISMVNELKKPLEKQQQPISHCHPESVIKNGYAVIIHNMKYKKEDIGSPVSSTVMDEFFRLSSFKTDLYTDVTALELERKIQELLCSDNLRTCDAFLLFFMGFGDYGGQLFGTDGAPVSIKTDILQNFNAENCPALSGKPKIFCFQMAKPVEVPMDHTDCDMQQQLTASQLWSDMIIFSSLTSVTCDSETFDGSFDHSNYMHRAIARVACKFAHELSLYDILRKVETILKCQKVTAKIGSTSIYTELHRSPGMRPVYLQLSA